MDHLPLFESKFHNLVHELEDTWDAQALIEMYHEANSPNDKKYISDTLMVVMDKTPIEIALILNKE